MYNFNQNNLCVLIDSDEISEVHLTKDVGEIPKTYCEVFDGSSSIFFWGNRKIQNYDERVKLNRVFPIWKLLRWVPSLYIRRSVSSLLMMLIALPAIRKSKLLMIFHLQPQWGFSLFFTRWMFPNTRIHLKMDISQLWLSEMREQEIQAPKYVKNNWARLLKLADIVSLETSDTFKLIQSRPLFGVDLDLRLILMPNGVSTQMAQSVNSVSKEKRILTVGRLGTEQKNTEMLLEALASVELKDWTIDLVGSLEPEFEKWLNNFLQVRPDLSRRIQLWGHLTNRDELSTIMARSSVFCLTSRWEGSALVLLEALAHGCALLSTEVGAAADLIRNRGTGLLIQSGDVNALATAIQSIVDGEWNLVEMEKLARKLINDELRWPIILKRMNSFWFPKRQRR